MISAGLTRRRDRLDGASAPQLDLEPLAGRWIVFAEETTGISEVEIETAPGGGVEARVTGSAREAAPDWGRAPAHVYGDDVSGGEVWGFRATYDHDYERVELFGYLNRGLLCVEAGTTFVDESGRSPYFTRTFLFRP